MLEHRRTILKGVGAFAATAATGRMTEARADSNEVHQHERGMARGLTLLTMRVQGEFRLGVKTKKGILDAHRAAKILNMAGPSTMDDLLQAEDGPRLNGLVDAALKSRSAQKAFVKVENIEYGPLVTRPEKIVCVGLNYRRHAHEIGQPLPKVPVLFSKFNVALNSHNGKIRLPVNVARKFDYEIELVIVMGKEAADVNEEDALSDVAGYATGNDFSARDLQLETGGQWLIGKTPNQFAPLGPYMVTAEQIDPDNLKIECRVNGETRQSSNTSDMIHSNRHIISYVSRYVTLRPGDIIFTGTPEGVILGKPKDQQIWLKAGDKIACSVEKLGELKFDLT
jgi:2-keto-4-pentenoate hydratase/2-oxohepta-3-ene-1,7-dioic acid hydratase in catechol pathway